MSTTPTLSSTPRPVQRPDLTCVIVAYHRPEPLARLLQTLAHPRIKIVVVNVEADSAVTELSGAEIIPVPVNRGYAAGVNVGVARASTSVIAFMNDDLEVTASDILTLAARVQSLHADVVVPLVEGQDGKPEFAEKVPYRLAERMQLKGRPVPDHPIRVDAAWASLVVARADLLNAVPLPEEYFMYWEELDWFFHLRQRLVRVEFIPTVRVRHLGGITVVRPDKSRLMARNAVRCVRRTRGRTAALRAWPHVVAWQARLWLTSLLSRRWRDEAPSHLAGVVAAASAWREI
ncbi:MAG: glycosyltransferase family 2 protein [Candidatus Dormibacteraeota bacterium]|uniref:Glycosyltransferase family 2 protein n=1 Tax=Candidatus Amunia macphersoniae TaxID=3127014 RepID=A0A934KLY5_9BACT|nr:glycosyltransferase family 2 protein [Candidatus Dormibacteraeota bacterium]